MSYRELTELRDPEKPHKRIYQFPDGVCVKVHAVRAQSGFGAVRWTFSASHCDSQGRALPYADGYAIHPDTHELTLASDAPKDPQEILKAFDAAARRVIERVRAALQNEAAARALSGH